MQQVDTSSQRAMIKSYLPRSYLGDWRGNESQAPTSIWGNHA